MIHLVRQKKIGTKEEHTMAGIDIGEQPLTCATEEASEKGGSIERLSI